MKRFISLVILVLVLFLTCCSMKDSDTAEAMNGSSSFYGKSDDAAPSGYYEGYGEAFADVPSGRTDSVPKEGEEASDILETKEEKEQEVLRAGQLTASATFDNEKYAFWKSLLTSNQEGRGLFQDLNDQFAFKTANRLTLTFPKGTFARVSLYDMENKNVEFVGTTDANGVCYLYGKTNHLDKEGKASFKLTIEYIDKQNNLVTIDDVVDGDKTYDLEALDAKRELIEIMFVIDATGSMGDEMRYLQAEITDVIKRVKAANDNVKILLSVMVYRDKGDEYVTKYNDFTENVSDQIAFLNKQYASGGGDFPEAVQTALTEALNKQWTSGNSTKILVHVADAPAHDEDVELWETAVLGLAGKGIRILTVASSGIDKNTEYFFRCQSLLTNGVYVHLTNDSGIGGDHIDATTEDKEEVELLNDLLVRLINGFHTGDFGTAVNWRQSQSSPQS